MKLSLQDLKLTGQRILMRVDFNVPLADDGSIRDDSRIRQALPSIEYVLQQGGKLILISHLGRPKGKKEPKLSLKPVAMRLEKLIGKHVLMAPDAIGPEVEKLVSSLQDSDVLMLENIRFHEGEEHPEKDSSFVASLAKLGDAYVNDAFGTAHRSHASTALIAESFPKKSALGFLIEKEISFLSRLLLNPKRPFYALIGGAKVRTKIGVVKALTEKVDAIFIGGGMAFTFLKSQGISIGDSLCDDDHLELTEALLKSCEKKAVQVFLPEDFVIAKEFSNESERKVVCAKQGIPTGWRGMDIGPNTIGNWSTFLNKGATIFWNGPMGVFEFSHFAQGTCAIAHSLAELGCTVVVGGGDSVAAINSLNLQKSFTHISTGGGASLEYIEYGHLSGIDALSDR